MTGVVGNGRHRLLRVCFLKFHPGHGMAAPVPPSSGCLRQKEETPAFRLFPNRQGWKEIVLLSINYPKSAGQRDFYRQFKIELSDTDPVDRGPGACEPTPHPSQTREKIPSTRYPIGIRFDIGYCLYSRFVPPLFTNQRCRSSATGGLAITTFQPATLAAALITNFRLFLKE